MRSRGALTLSLALMAACFLPASALAAGSEQGISRLSTLLEVTGIADLVYGVPVHADGVAGPSGPESGFAGGDEDGDGADDDGTTDSAGADAGDESETPPNSSESGETGGYGDDATNTGLNNSSAGNTGSSVAAQSLLQIIIEIIFGQDRPWDDERRQKQG